MEAVRENTMVLDSPEPFARISRITEEGVIYELRVWCKTDCYWPVYHDLTQAVAERLISENIQLPGKRIIEAKK